MRFHLFRCLPSYPKQKTPQWLPSQFHKGIRVHNKQVFTVPFQVDIQICWLTFTYAQGNIILYFQMSFSGQNYFTYIQMNFKSYFICLWQKSSTFSLKFLSRNTNTSALSGIPAVTFLYSQNFLLDYLTSGSLQFSALC